MIECKNDQTHFSVFYKLEVLRTVFRPTINKRAIGIHLWHPSLVIYWSRRHNALYRQDSEIPQEVGMWLEDAIEE